jgi:hypothetical protein
MEIIVSNAVIFATMGFTLMSFIREQAPCRKQDFLVIDTLMIKATKEQGMFTKHFDN